MFKAMNKIANVENVVCSTETMSRYPELYHYTSASLHKGGLATRHPNGSDVGTEEDKMSPDKAATMWKHVRTCRSSIKNQLPLELPDWLMSFTPELRDNSSKLVSCAITLDGAKWKMRTTVSF
jgi:hypothetical protein